MCVGGREGRGRGEEGEDKNERKLEKGRVLMLITVTQCTHVVHMLTRGTRHLCQH